MDIRSRYEYPAGALSNFTGFKFVFDGVQCASMEGLLQSFKYEDIDAQKAVCSLVGYSAYKKGSERTKYWQSKQTLWWNGKAYSRKGSSYQMLLNRAYNCLYNQNKDFKKALEDAGKTTVFTHSLGKSSNEVSILTEQEFCSRLQYLKDHGLLPEHNEKMSITLYPTVFTVDMNSEKSKLMRPYIEKYISAELTTFKYEYVRHLRKNIRMVDKRFAMLDNNTMMYYLNINVVKPLLYYLATCGLKKEDIEIIKTEDYKIDKLNLKLSNKFILREYQDTTVDMLTSDDAESQQLVDLKTGYGKGIISIAGLCKIDMKTGIIIKPNYIEKWIIELKEKTDIEDEDIFIIRGSESIYKLMTDEVDFKIAIISLRTMSLYIDRYLRNEEEIHPIHILRKIHAGVLLNDETHQEFYAVYLSNLFLAPKRFIGLSATMVHRDANMVKIYNSMFPTRINNVVEYTENVDVVAISYSMLIPKKFKFKTPQGYNHVKFEQSLVQYPKLLNGYLDMITHYVQTVYCDVRKNKQKLIIFASTIAFCTILTNHLKKVFKEYNVVRFTQDDSYDELMASDIAVSTLLKAGTALDIKGLIAVVNTVPMASMQYNQQSAGRLREIDDTDTTYYYLYSINIPDHIRLHKERRSSLDGKTKSYKYDRYDKTLSLSYTQ